jgi:hypothetical protein
VTIVVPLVAFLIMVVVFVLVARRTGRVVAETREAEAFRRSVEDLALRVDVSLGGIVERIDAVRRHQVPPTVIGDDLTVALDALERHATEASNLDGPPSAAGLRTALRAELERAQRALLMVEHGCGMLATSRGIGRDTEGETAVKRGYLNLLHAREAIADYAAEIVETKGGIEPRWYSRRRSA